MSSATSWTHRMGIRFTNGLKQNPSEIQYYPSSSLHMFLNNHFKSQVIRQLDLIRREYNSNPIHLKRNQNHLSMANIILLDHLDSNNRHLKSTSRRSRRWISIPLSKIKPICWFSDALVMFSVPMADTKVFCSARTAVLTFIIAILINSTAAIAVGITISQTKSSANSSGTSSGNNNNNNNNQNSGMLFSDHCLINLMRRGKTVRLFSLFSFNTIDNGSDKQCQYRKSNWTTL